MRALVLPALLLVAAGAAQAAGIASEGRIDSDFTWTARQQTMPTAGGMEAFTAEAFLVLTATSAGSVLDKLAARCLMAGTQNPKGSEYRSSGSCTFTDTDNDQIFETLEETRAVFHSVGSGVAAEAEPALGILGRDGGERRAELDVERI